MCIRDRSSAEGEVQNLKYKATFPILINAGGHPTYFLSLKDDANLVKKYAFVSVENYQLVATGDSVAQAEQAYYCLLYTSYFSVDLFGLYSIEKISWTDYWKTYYEIADCENG